VKLTGKQWKQLQDALLDAFPDPGSFTRMVKFGLDLSLSTITIADSMAERVFALIQYTEARDKTIQLIAAARDANADNAALLGVAQQFALAPSLPPDVQPEAMVRAANKFQDVEQWISRFGAILPKVCRIEIAANTGPIWGTGFLLGPDVVMTNYHVMEAVILGEQGGATAKGESAQPGNVVLRFDYKRLADGTTLNSGTPFHLPGQGWLLDSSPFADLDYALLRVADAPGDSPVGTQANNPDPSAPRRGFLTPVTGYQFQPHTPLSIVQHPQSAPLQLAMDTDAIIEVNAAGTRVTYRTNTLPGSSGSPCFNADWDLVALHHAGDPNFFRGPYNEGIPFAAILDRLKTNSKLDALGK
jgi:hypothetical protein